MGFMLWIWISVIVVLLGGKLNAEIRRLKRENAELRRANEILKAASAFFAAELDRPQTHS